MILESNSGRFYTHESLGATGLNFKPVHSHTEDCDSEFAGDRRTSLEKVQV